MTALEAIVQRLEATVQHLTARLQQDSRTSRDSHRVIRPRRPRNGPDANDWASARRATRAPGAHAGVGPVEAVDVVVPVKPECCQRCQERLQGDDAQPQRHQVWEDPPREAGGDRVSVAPAGMPGVWRSDPGGVAAWGPQGGIWPASAGDHGPVHRGLSSVEAHHAERPGISVRVSLGLGTVANLEQATVQAVAEPVAEARAYVQAQPAAYLDETGWHEGQQRAWLWTAVTTWVTVFVVRRSRGGKVAQELLGERFWGWLVTDRWSADSWDPSWRRQLCWAHLLRDIEAMIARGGRSQELGEALRAQARQMFHWWHRVRDGTLAHTTFASDMRPIRREVERLLDAGQRCGVPKTEGTCRKISKLRQALWTFVRHEEVEPTNNAAERAIRPGVLWRKGSFGTQSPQGSCFVEAMMTVVATLKQQHRNVLTYVTAACEAALCGKPAPSLLPTHMPYTRSSAPLLSQIFR